MFKGFVSLDCVCKLVKMVEEVGFDYCWFYDFYILWCELFVVMVMCMEYIIKMCFGFCVINFNVCDWLVVVSLYGSLVK